MPRQSSQILYEIAIWSVNGLNWKLPAFGYPVRTSINFRSSVWMEDNTSEAGSDWSLVGTMLFDCMNVLRQRRWQYIWTVSQYRDEGLRVRLLSSFWFGQKWLLLADHCTNIPFTKLSDHFSGDDFSAHILRLELVLQLLPLRSLFITSIAYRNDSPFEECHVVWIYCGVPGYSWFTFIMLHSLPAFEQLSWMFCISN